MNRIFKKVEEECKEKKIKAEAIKKLYPLFLVVVKGCYRRYCIQKNEKKRL
jgi:hypothetical protein